ncbi:hypothetical protein A0J61_03576 [Choanephora cucurbitarum]|uniref:Uncharacterized protein n=1 Tax=Choanephora cucurbitarum TaxID=101091 RepID=A0A1C7NM84_9FUNG|nr:hypothetical protein A0J61_03576 [Choanephora cucurbitarum]
MSHDVQVNSKLLKCIVCHKQFARYDQRGFRNPGFTAHQNRCIDRRYQSKTKLKPKLKPRPNLRTLLPAPVRHSGSMQRLARQSNPSYSTKSTLATAPIGSTTSFDSRITTSAVTNEFVFADIQCNYCIPQFGRHRISCLFAAKNMNHRDS